MHVLRGPCSFIVVWLVCCTIPPVQAQRPLQRYIEAGLRDNLGLRQEQIELEKGLRALDEARGLFLPSLSLEARLSLARGGRTIDLPLGDLLNPVYGTLNRLTEQMGQPGAFPTIENEEVRFLREREQDTRFRVTQPVYQPRLFANHRLRQSLAASQEAAVEVYRNALTRDIRRAYYTYLKADQAVATYQAGARLVAENLRVNESLLRNAKVTNDVVLRARAEVLTVAQELAGAEKDREIARSYLNFLLNRPLDSAVETEPLSEAAALADLVLAHFTAPRTGETSGDGETSGAEDLSDWEDVAVERRPELDQMDAALAATEAGVQAARSAFLPSAALALDAGIQGRAYGFEGDAPYAVASFMLQWNLFTGRQNRARLAQARLEHSRRQAEREMLEQQIRLQVREALQEVRVARRSLDTAAERVQAAREGYRLVARRYDEGLTSQIAMLDARTTLTGAEINLTLTRADLMISLAELDFSVALGAASLQTLFTAREQP